MVIIIICDLYTERNGCGGNLDGDEEPFAADWELWEAVEVGSDARLSRKVLVVGEGELILIVCVSFSGVNEGERRRYGVPNCDVCRAGWRRSGFSDCPKGFRSSADVDLGASCESEWS